MYTFFKKGLPPARTLIVAMGASALLASMGHAGKNSFDKSNDTALVFNKSKYTTITVVVDGKSIPLRWYKEVCYVAKPVTVASQQTKFGRSTTVENPACGYQSMNIFVPESSAANQKTAIYFSVDNSGWFHSYIKTSLTNGSSYSSSTSNVAAAIKAGYVYIDVGTRGRGLVGADGSYQGKAPAAVVDAKAAIRYLRLNDDLMPGSAEKIVINGTSGGGGLVSIVGASGNSEDYLPELQAIGAAGVTARGFSTLRDDVFLVNAYCPITDLGNADLAYEWLYTVLGTRATVGANASPAASAAIAAKFPGYQASLHLRERNGQGLTAANMLNTIGLEVARSAQYYLQASSSNSIPALGADFVITSTNMGGVTTSVNYTNDWIDVDAAARKVKSIDIEKYLKFVAKLTTLKGTPAFDATGIGSGSGESNLFGSNSQVYSNFTEYTWNNNSIGSDGSGYDDTGILWSEFIKTSSGRLVTKQKNMVNPMHYILNGAGNVAPYWYIRHGTRDRDTAFTVSINLSRALQQNPDVKEVNYRLAWNQPHAGNYDVPEFTQWLTEQLAKSERRGH